MRRGAFVASAAAFAAAPGLARAANDADALFMRIANAAAERFAQSPASVSYTVAGTVRAFHGEGTFERSLTYSAADATPAFLAPPTFDALSHWTFDMEFDSGPTVEAHFSNVEPLRYRTDIVSRADAIVNAVKGYRLRRLPDQGGRGRIGLERIERKGHDASLREVAYDPATLLPVRVVYEGKDDFFLDVSYVLADRFWLVSALRFGYTAYTLGHLVHSSFACEAAYTILAAFSGSS